VLFVHGGPATAVVRGPAGESVVLLSGELPEVLTDQSVTELVELAAAVLDADELPLFHTCLRTLRRDGLRRPPDRDRRSVPTVYEG
jgi:hypothetical protein